MNRTQKGMRSAALLLLGAMLLTSCSKSLGGGKAVRDVGQAQVNESVEVIWDHLWTDTFNSQFGSYQTRLRLSNDYSSKVRDVFESSDFPFAADINGSFASAIAGDKEQRNEPGKYPEKWNIQELILDGQYDISELSSQYGTVFLNVTSRDVSVKTASESLLRIKAIMEQNNLPFKSVELWVLSEKTDDLGNPAEQLHILNFGWDDIYEEGLEERVKEAVAVTESYYNK